MVVLATAIVIVAEAPAFTEAGLKCMSSQRVDPLQKAWASLHSR